MFEPQATVTSVPVCPVLIFNCTETVTGPACLFVVWTVFRLLSYLRSYVLLANVFLVFSG